MDGDSAVRVISESGLGNNEVEAAQRASSRSSFGGSTSVIDDGVRSAGLASTSRPRSLLSSALRRSSTNRQSRSRTSAPDADTTQVNEPSSPSHQRPSSRDRRPLKQLSDLARFELDVSLDSWKMPEKGYKEREPWSLKFIAPDVEAEFQRFQLHSASVGSKVVASASLGVLAVVMYEAAGSIPWLIYVALVLLHAIVLAAMVLKTLYDRDSSNATVSDESLNESTIVAREHSMATLYERLSIAALGIMAAACSVVHSTYDVVCAEVFDTTEGSNKHIHHCRHALSAGPFVIAMVGVLAFRVNFYTHAVFVVGCGLFAALGTIPKTSETLAPFQHFILVLALVALPVALLPLVHARDAALRNRFVLLADVFLASELLAHHQENLWALLRAVVPSMILPRMRIAASGDAARVVDHGTDATVAVAGVWNFDKWSQSLLPFNVVLSLSRLFMEFDRCLANVDSAVAGKAVITGDRYIVVGNLFDQSTFSRRGLSASQSQLSDTDSKTDRNSGTSLASSSLLLLDVAEEQIRLGALVREQSPAVCGELAVAVGMASGELFAGIAGMQSLRYLVAGPALEAALALQEASTSRVVATTAEVRDAVEQVYPNEVMWSRSGTTWEARRAYRSPGSPGLHNVVIGDDLAAPSGRQSPTTEPTDLVNGRGLTPSNTDGFTPQAGSPVHAEAPASPRGDAPSVPLSPNQPDLIAHPPVEVLANSGRSTPQVDDRGASAHGAGVSATSTVSNALLSQASLLSTAAAEHRTHVADDRALELALEQATSMLERDPCTGRFKNEDVELSLQKFTADDDRRFASHRVLSMGLSMCIILLCFFLDAMANSFVPTHDDAPEPSSFPILSNLTTAAPVTTQASSSSGSYSYEDEGSRFLSDSIILGLVLLGLGCITCGIMGILAVKQLQMPTYVELLVCCIVCLAASLTSVLARHNVMSHNPAYLVPTLSFSALINMARPHFAATGTAIVCFLGVPMAISLSLATESQHEGIYIRAVAFCVILCIVAATTAWMVRTRFAAVLLAGDFLHVSKQRFMIRESLLRGLLPPHVVDSVSEAAASPEEMRLMADRPHSLEVWEELVVVHVRFTGTAPSAPSASSSTRERKGGRSADDFDIAVARLNDVHDAIAKSTDTDETRRLLDVVEVTGSTVVVAGCLPPIHNTPSYDDVQIRASAAARAAVRFIRLLVENCNERADACTALAVTESGYGAILGSQLLNYCVLGVARRTAAAMHNHLPAFGPPGVASKKSHAFGLESFKRLCGRRPNSGSILDVEDDLVSNPFTPVSPDATVHGPISSSSDFGNPIRCSIRSVGSVELYPIAMLPTEQAPSAPLFQAHR